MSTKQVTKKTTAKKAAAPKKAAKKEVEATPTVATEEVKQDETPTTTVAATPATKTSKKSTPKKQRTRRVVTRETLDTDFTELQKRVEAEIDKLRQSNEKVKGVKFLRSVNKAIKILKSDSVRVMKIKPKTNRPRSTTSGFMKPVRISEEMATFTGWENNKLYSRVDVTKHICKYIREKSLQNPTDRRQIVCDDKLKQLLKYDSATAKEPLTYFRLQQYIQCHFIKEAGAATEVADTEESVDVEEDEE
jgi:chromatin remodeling complex protein RSC6